MVTFKIFSSFPIRAAEAKCAGKISEAGKYAGFFFGGGGKTFETADVK